MLSVHYWPCKETEWEIQFGCDVIQIYIMLALISKILVQPVASDTATDLVSIGHNLVAIKRAKELKIPLKVEPLYYPEAKKNEGLILACGLLGERSSCSK